MPTTSRLAQDFARQRQQPQRLVPRHAFGKACLDPLQFGFRVEHRGAERRILSLGICIARAFAFWFTLAGKLNVQVVSTGNLLPDHLLRKRKAQAAQAQPLLIIPFGVGPRVRRLSGES